VLSYPEAARHAHTGGDQQALNEYHGEDQFFIFMDTNNSYYDEQGSWVDVAPKGVYVKAYCYDTVKRMFEGVKK
jgi:hypothetical protein